MAEPLSAVARPIHQHTRRGRVTINPDEATFDADIVLVGGDGPNAEDPILWNGFIACPLLPKAETQRLVDLCNAIALDVENPRFAWVGDLLLQFEWDGSVLDTPDDSGALYSRTVYSPDHAGRYAIGAWSWTWVEAEEPSGPSLRAEADANLA